MGTECEVLALNCLVMVYIDRCPLTALVPRFLKRCFFPSRLYKTSQMHGEIVCGSLQQYSTFVTGMTILMCHYH